MAIERALGGRQIVVPAESSSVEAARVLTEDRVLA